MEFSHRIRPALMLLFAAGASVFGTAPDSLAQQSGRTTVERGEYLFTDGYKCYACHGYDGQSGLKRLVPLNYNLPGFTALVQNSPFPQMPSFNDVPAEDLADIFAYIQTIPADAPELDDIELLRDIARRKQDALGN